MKAGYLVLNLDSSAALEGLLFRLIVSHAASAAVFTGGNR